MLARSALLIVLSTTPAFVASSCYSRNGTLITDIAYQPCSSSGESACCGTNHDGAGHSNVANDVCESNGLCQNYEAFDGTNEGVKLWWRQGCTDPTWSSPNCLANVCATAEYEDDNAPVYSCGNGNWACGSKSYCSTSSRLFTLAATVGKEVVTSTSASSASSGVIASSQTTPAIVSATPSGPAQRSSTSLTTATFAAATSTAPASQPLLSTAAKAGIGAGIAVLLLLLSIILFLLHKIKKNKKAQEAYAKAELPGQSAPMSEKPQMTVYAREASHDAVEMPAREVGAHEMTGGKERIELETRKGANEIGLQRERAELAAHPSVNVRGNHT
ncbi:hypothetical protein E8E12_001193 [Didymella heteroderae]|uniref:Uncharacterized protein n=1 Tax=Didymella heteroderae TaxID=1769908 RepID=A0A9P5C3D0_9PLEO|nr:hypothetical protein E8E12_001193 [Didymella heteroderae]